MKTLWHAFDGLPIWPRLTLLGILVGIVAGAASGGFYVATLISWSAVEYRNDPASLLGIIFLYGGMALVVGGVVGGVLGGLTGVLAGSALAGFLRMGVRGAAATWATLSVVVSIQVALGLAIVLPSWWWLSLITPVISAAPMAIAVRDAAKSWSLSRGVQAGRA